MIGAPAAIPATPEKRSVRQSAPGTAHAQTTGGAQGEDFAPEGSAGCRGAGSGIHHLGHAGHDGDLADQTCQLVHRGRPSLAML